MTAVPERRTWSRLPDAELLQLRFFKAKVEFYTGIVNRNRAQGKFLLGWLNRILKESAK